METIKQLVWCAMFTIGVCAVVVALLMLGAYLDRSIQPDKDKIVTCTDGKRGFYSCKTEYF